MRNRFIEYRDGVETVIVKRHAAHVDMTSGELVRTHAHLEIDCTLDIANAVLNYLRAGGAELTGEMVEMLPQAAADTGDRHIELEDGDGHAIR